MWGQLHRAVADPLLVADVDGARLRARPHYSEVRPVALRLQDRHARQGVAAGGQLQPQPEAKDRAAGGRATPPVPLCVRQADGGRGAFGRAAT
eukprot:4726746-Prymnesium_polylepis.1